MFWAHSLEECLSMLIENRLSIERWNKALNYAIAAWTLLIVVCGSLFFYLFQDVGLKKKPLQIEPKIVKRPLKVSEITLDEKDSGVWIPLPRVQDKVFFFGLDKRPSMEGGVWLGTEADGKSLYHVGDKLFLECKDQEDITFSATPTPFWLELTACQEGGLETVLNSVYETEEGELLLSSTKEVRLQERSWGRREKGGLVASLSKMKCYPPDQLLDLYGGTLFREMRGLRRLDLEGRGERMHFVQGGEKFRWNGEIWVSSKEEKEGEPLLWVEKLEGQECHLVLFDAEGYTMQTFVITQEKPVQSFSVKPSELFTNLRMRSNQSVLCKLAQQSTILRVGDWLLRSKKGWRTVQTREDLKSYLCYALQGELFVFDGIVRAKGGYLFTGHLFDEKRTSVQKIELPLGERKIARKEGKKPVGQASHQASQMPWIEEREDNDNS